MSTPSNGSIIKAFAILDLFDDRRPEVTAGQVAELTGLNAVTAHRFLRTLLQIGVLKSPRKGVFSLGGKMIDYGERAKSFSRLAAQLQPFLNELAAMTQEGAMATTFDGSLITCIATAHSEHTFSFNARVGARMEAYATANGKLWLSTLEPAALDSYFLTNKLDAISAQTLIDETSLRAELATIRDRHMAFNRGERETGLSAVAVPVMTAAGTMLVGMSVFGPSARFGDAKEKQFLQLLRHAAKRIQDTL
jgi:IclR family pca regulon transcriptional regulator